jgi:hypothetical protein
MALIVQSKVGAFAGVGVAATVTLDAAATAGNTLVVALSAQIDVGTRALATAGFTLRHDPTAHDGDSTLYVYTKVAVGGETTLSTNAGVGVSGVARLAVYEVAGSFDSSSEVQEGNQLLTTFPAATVSPVLVDNPGVLLAFFDIYYSTFAVGALSPDGDLVERDESHVLSERLTAWTGYQEEASLDASYAPSITSTVNPGLSETSNKWACVVVVLSGVPGPGEPDVPPPDVEPLDPGRAIIEIYTTPADSDRWDVALWDTGVWSAAEWVDISPWCVTADVGWGADRGDYGILATIVAGSWVISTFDPDRVLDPSNADSPFYPELVAGLPIRINHEAVTIRTGVVYRLTYSHADEGGTISATDAIADLARAKVPADAVLGDTLYERARDAIAAAGLDLFVRRDRRGPSPDPDLAAYVPGEASVWDVIAAAALEVLHVPSINSAGELTFRAWSNPLRRGYALGSPELIDLEAWTDDTGLYSVVRVLDDDTSTVIERRATPTPRYGERVYERTEPTIHGEAWADAILADRRDQALRFIPGDVRPLTAASVRELVKRQIVEDITLTVPEAVPDVIVEARILGIRLRAWDETVEYPDNIRTRWRWRFVTTEAAVSPLIADGVIPDEFLFADQDTTQPLYPDGVLGL